MRIHSYITAFSLVSILALPSCVHHHNNHDLKISVQESGGSYTFSAAFPEDKTANVHRVVNHSMAPNGLFASVHDYLNVTTTLQDKTNFAVKAYPGFIQVTVNRTGNSPVSYDRIKDMCAEIKKSLKD